MIKRFHALYVGQIELENIGLQGTPADDRRYGNERLSEPFLTARDVAQLMDELGYYALWTAEHHFQHEGYECFPNLIQLSLWLATQTRAPQARLRVQRAARCGIPIRLAEDYAMADIVTDGRVIMGVGRGYHSREVESFGAPVIDQAANRELFEEQVELMLKCFNEESFSHHGKHYDVPAAGRVPRLPAAARSPACRGRSTCRSRSGCRSPAASPSTTWRRTDFKAMVTLNGEKILDDVVKAYRDACAKHGRPKQLGEDMIWGAGLYLADTPEEAKRRVEPSHDERYKWFAPFGFVRYADEQGRTWGTPGAPARMPSLARRHPAEGVVLRPARARHRGHQVDRGEVPRARGLHDPLGRGPLAQGVQGAAALVRARRDAGVPGLAARRTVGLRARNSCGCVTARCAPTDVESVGAPAETPLPNS